MRDVKKMWKLSDWDDWVSNHPETTDVSLQINVAGEIPISCPRCKKKLQDIIPKNEKSGSFIRKVYCDLCEFSGKRYVGKMKRG